MPSEAAFRGERLNLKPGDRVRVIGARGTAKIHVILTNMHRSLLENEIDPLRTAFYLLRHLLRLLLKPDLDSFAAA